MLTGTLERSYWFLTLQNPCLTWRLFFALQLFNIATVSNTVTSYRVGPERPTPVGSCPKQVGSCPKQVGSCAASAMWCTCEGGLGQQGEAWANYQTQSVETLGTMPSREEILRPLCSVDHSCWSVDMMCISLFDWSNSEVFYQQAFLLTSVKTPSILYNPGVTVHAGLTASISTTSVDHPQAINAVYFAMSINCTPGRDLL